MKATFTGVPGEQHDSVHMYGQDFPLNKAVTVNTSVARRKLANHPHFKVQAEKSDEADDAQIKREFTGAAEAGLADAEAQRLADEERAREASIASRTPAPAPQEQTPEPMRSAQEYQQRMETGPVGTSAAMPDTIRSAAEYQALETAGGVPRTGQGDVGTTEAAQAEAAQARTSSTSSTAPSGKTGSGKKG